MLQRTLRHAMTSRLFHEVDGKVAHTPTSALLVSNENLAAFVDLHTEVALKSLAHTMDALEKWPNSTNPREVGYSIAIGKPGERGVYEDLAQNPARTVKFGKAMQFFSSGEGYEVSSLVEGYPWGEIGKGVVVDVRSPLTSSSYADQTRLGERTASQAQQSPKHSQLSNSLCKIFAWSRRSKSTTQTRTSSGYNMIISLPNRWKELMFIFIALCFTISTMRRLLSV